MEDGLPEPLRLPRFDASRPGEPVRILSTKYDGSRHYEYRGRLVDQGEGYLRVVVEPNTPFVSYRESGMTLARMTQIYFTDRWYNAFHNHEPVGRRAMLTYCNVGTPVRLEGDTIHWIDLDLDVIDTQAQGLIVDDEDEFADHRQRMAYPEEVVRRAEAARDELLALGRSHAFPFDRESHLP
ncbi:MAG: DUF402 domain-containing protein [Dehalococcoidia bacterium]|nr:DUF402 domain-containing protein [Dehalococcoidia bacterium]